MLVRMEWPLSTAAIKKIKTCIARYERNFKKPPHACLNDGGGTRFLLGPMYLLIDDTEGALKHYRWFQRKFPDSIDEPLHTLSWTLALLRSNQPAKALEGLKRTHLANAYLIPGLLNIPHRQPPDLRRYCSWQQEDVIQDILPKYLQMWTQNELDWLTVSWERPELQTVVAKDIELRLALENEITIERRCAIIEQRRVLREEPVPVERKLRLLTLAETLKPSPTSEKLNQAQKRARQSPQS